MFLFVEYYCLLSNRAGLEQVEERMNLTPGEDDFDGFWRVQLAGTSSSAAGARPFDSEAPIIGYKVHEIHNFFLVCTLHLYDKKSAENNGYNIECFATTAPACPMKPCVFFVTSCCTVGQRFTSRR